MIRTIVELYRIAVAAIFVVGVIALIPIWSAFGVIGSILWLLALTVGLGVSALLLSINDHLAALRSASRPEPSAMVSTLNRGTAAASVVAFLLIMLVGIGLSYKRTPDAAAPTLSAPTARPETSADGNPMPDDLDKNGCSPKLAATIGLKCGTSGK